MVVVTRMNHLELRLVNGGAELDAAQALRYEIFHGEMGARATPQIAERRRDFDRYDAFADHLVAVDLERSSRAGPFVAGCYRILRESVAARSGLGGLYTGSEFDLSGVKAPHGEMMELGRSCVHADYRRSSAVMQILWRGIAEYLETYGVGLMLGCASLPGTDPDALAPVLSYLHHRHLASPELRPRALPDRFVRADRLPADQVNDREALRQLPPLLKGYLRLGGMIGEGAVIDEQFNTTDVCLVLPTASVQARYQRHMYGDRQSSSVAAAA